MKARSLKENPLAGNLSRAVLVGVLCALGTGGCSTTDPDTIERDFGNSVRRMVEAQKYGPVSTSQRPTPMDGIKAQEVVKTYREDVARPKQTEQPLKLTFGTSRK